MLKKNVKSFKKIPRRIGGLFAAHPWRDSNSPTDMQKLIPSLKAMVSVAWHLFLLRPKLCFPTVEAELLKIGSEA